MSNILPPFVDSWYGEGQLFVTYHSYYTHRLPVNFASLESYTFANRLAYHFQTWQNYSIKAIFSAASWIFAERSSSKHEEKST